MCLEVGEGGAPVGTLLGAAEEDELEGLATAVIGLKTRGFWILRPALSPWCLRLRTKYPNPDPPPTPSARTINGKIGPIVAFTKFWK